MIKNIKIPTTYGTNAGFFFEFSMLLPINLINLMGSCNPISVLLDSGREGGVENFKNAFFFYISEAIKT